MPEQSTPKLALKPVLRWRRLLLGLVVLLLGAVGIYYGWGYYHERQLIKEIEQLRQRGEPMLAADFAARQQDVADGENAALALSWAVDSIDEWSEAGTKFWLVYQQLPLSEEEMRILSAGLEANREPLLRLREARQKAGVNWQVVFGKPLGESSSLMKRQSDLAGLALGEVLVMHQMGRDREALERLRDVMMMIRVNGQGVTGLSGWRAKGLTTRVSRVIYEIADDLRVGQSASQADPQQVRQLIGELLEEMGPAQMQRNEIRWDRAVGVDFVRAVVRGEQFPELKRDDRDDRMFGLAARPILMRDARLLLAHWNEAVAMSDQSPTWASFAKASDEGTAIERMVRSNPKRYLMADFSVKNWQKGVFAHWTTTAERRMAALALAIRWYAGEHEGRLPQKLEELVPKYLPVMPADPMALGGGRFGYVPDESRLVIYSIGINGKDDGGSEEILPTTFETGRWDREDAVVHLKRKARKHFPVQAPAERR